MIGSARHFSGKKGIFCGEKILNYPAGASPHTTSVWFRAEQPNSTIIGWGNEGGGRGSKIRMQFRSPPHLHIDSDFSDIKGESRLPRNEWIHVVHTYGTGPRRIYINGKLDGEAATKLDIKSPARLWLGGWYNNYDFIGDIDEVRISKVARSADWVRLEYENQKPLQTLAGSLVQAGNAFTVSPESATILEGKNATFTAHAGGAQKLFWILKSTGQERVVAVDRLSFTFEAGRITGNTAAVLEVKAIYPSEVKTKIIAISITEAVPDPDFTLTAPVEWDGRATIEVRPTITNLNALQASGAGELKIEWSTSPFAVIKEIAPGKLILKRAQNSGNLTVTATISNGGTPVTRSTIISVIEPKTDAWIPRVPDKNERPEEGQFYARDDKNEGTLFYNGSLTEPADSVFIKVFAGEKLLKEESTKPGADKSYNFTVKLKPGLIKYRIEFGTKTGGKETVLHTVGNIVCGDAYLIDGQSNALATDTGEKSSPETNDWIRSYGKPNSNPEDSSANLWCNPVWKAQKGEQAELGWWGMELAKRLVESQKIPIFMINAAVGGTRIDQHQRNAAAPAELSCYYGWMLWRVQHAKLTHGIRAIIWHQGENDQGSDGTHRRLRLGDVSITVHENVCRLELDFPNVQHYYVFQIWPNSCSMGGRDGSGDRLREQQRTLPFLYSHMSILSTLGVRPPGGCHFPLAGWSEFARMIQPVIERDFYGKVPAASVTAPNLRAAHFISNTKETIALEFDQPVVWFEKLAGQIYLDGAKDQVASGTVSGNVLTLKLKSASAAKKITYLKEVAWNQDLLLLGANGLPALTFCEVPIAENSAK